MQDIPKQERKALMISAIGCLVIGCVGVTFAAISSSQAILLDGLFNLTYFATGLFTLKVARLLTEGEDETFPFGYAYFEPLVNGLKGLLVLGVSVMALAGAVGALFSGGRVIEPGPAIGYGIFATAACTILAVLTRRGARRTGSPLLEADAKNWLVNGAISTAVLLTFLSILLIRGSSLEYLLPYIDPVLVLTVVLISISVPVRMAWQALMELLNRAPSPEIVKETRTIVEQHTAQLPVQHRYIRITQPGRTRLVMTHIVLPPDFQIEGLPQLDAIRQNTLTALEATHKPVLLDMVFTADETWGSAI